MKPVEEIKVEGISESPSHKIGVNNISDEEYEDSRVNQVAAFGDPDLIGISEEELDAQCDELFGQYPIRFEPRSGDQMDQMIAASIYEHNFNIPIIWIKGRLYLIGSQRLTCQIKRNILMLRVGGGYEVFHTYISKYHRYNQRILVIHMIKSGESLEWVVDSLKNGQKIKNIHI
jgi:hypothetical protein